MSSPRSYLSPEDEEKYAHASSSIRLFGAVVFGYAGALLLIAAVTAPADFQIPSDNIYNATWETLLDEAFSSSRTWIVNRKGKNVTFERGKLLKDRLLRRIGMKRVDFGTTWNTYCWEDQRPPIPSFPSILRLLEFRPLTQSSLRLIVLTTIIWRMVFVYFRLADLKAIKTRNLPLLRSVLPCAPFLALADSFCSFWILLLHQDIDSAYRDWIPVALVLFGLFASLHMLVHLLIDFMGKNRSKRVILRIVCLAAFIAAVPYTIQLQLEFLRRKTCTPFVPLLSALPDLVVVLSLVLFTSSLMWELPNVVMHLCPLPAEFSVSTPFYQPAMNSAA